MKLFPYLSQKPHPSGLVCLAAAVLCTAWWAAPAAAQTFVADSLTYEIHSVQQENSEEMINVAIITAADAHLVHAVIPATVSHNNTVYPVFGFLNPYEGQWGQEETGSPFYNHQSLRSVTFGAGKFYLACFGFNACTNLNTVTFDPDCSVSINGVMFKGCQSLTSLDFPVRTTFSTSGKAKSLGGILCESGVRHIRISGEIDASYALESACYDPGIFCKSPELESVELGEGVTCVPPQCFAGCSKLASLTVPESLFKVGSSAFGSTSHAAYANPFLLNRPDGLIYIGKAAYAYKGDIAPGTVLDVRPGTRFICYELLYREKELAEATVRIPNSVEYFDGRIPENIEIEEGNPFFACIDGVLYGHGGTELIAAGNLTATDFTIPATVKVLYGGAFKACKALRSLTIPASVEELVTYRHITGTSGMNAINYGKDVAQDCNALERVTLQSGSILRSGTFTDCPTLKEVTIDGNWNTYDLTDSLFFQAPGGDSHFSTNMFINCPAIETLTFTDRVDYIAQLFSEATSVGIRTLNLPEDVRWIGNNAFQHFDQVRKIVMPRTEQCGSNLFAGCTNLEEIDMSRMNQDIAPYMFSHCTGLKTVKLPAGATQVGSRAFEGCTALTSVTLPESITHLGDSTFRNCAALQTINLDNVETMGSFCFAGCTALNELHAPAIRATGVHPMEGSGYSRTGGVYYLGTLACGYDISLPDSVPVPIDIREGTTEVLPMAFSRYSGAGGNDILPARNAKEIQLPVHIANSVKTIGAQAFHTSKGYRGYMAEFFNLPAGTEHIGDGAFASFSLTDSLIILPAGLKSIGMSAFYLGASGMRIYVQTAEPCEIAVVGNRSSFKMAMATQRSVTLYVPAGSKEAYAASPWGQVFRKIEEYSELPTAVHTPTADAADPAVRITAEGIRVSKAARVFTLGGQLVTETGEAATLRLPKGRHYIVVCGRTSVKVYVP